MRISDWSSDVCSSDLWGILRKKETAPATGPFLSRKPEGRGSGGERLYLVGHHGHAGGQRRGDVAGPLDQRFAALCRFLGEFVDAAGEPLALKLEEFVRRLHVRDALLINCRLFDYNRKTVV